MANLFDFHLFPAPVEHMAKLLTEVTCAPSRAAACSLPPPWSGGRLLWELQPEGQGSRLWCLAKERPGGHQCPRQGQRPTGAAVLQETLGACSGGAWGRHQLWAGVQTVKKPKKRHIQMTDGCVGFCLSLSNSLFGCKERAKGSLASHS